MSYMSYTLHSHYKPDNSIIVISCFSSFLYSGHGERSGSVVECLTQDRWAVGLRLTGVPRCILEQDTLILT